MPAGPSMEVSHAGHSFYNGQEEVTELFDAEDGEFFETRGEDDLDLAQTREGDPDRARLDRDVNACDCEDDFEDDEDEPGADEDDAALDVHDDGFQAGLPSADEAVSADVAGLGADVADCNDGDPSPASPKRARRGNSRGPRSSSAGAADVSCRLKELAKPRQIPELSPEDLPQQFVRPQKKVQAARPSTLLRLKPTNLEEAREAFFASGFTEAPRFIYAYPEELVSQLFEENSNVCFEMLGDAKRILQRVVDEYGDGEQYMKRLNGDEKISAEQLRDIVQKYLQEHNVEDKTDVRIVEGMLSVASVAKSGSDDRYVVNLGAKPCSKAQVQGICDHEVGTHLLRMMNDDNQIWHGCRKRYKLANPWTTEEGFATLNTYQSLPAKLLYPQALNYWAVCRGAQAGFVELFRDIQTHVGDPNKCWTMCCRIKRGMVDTSLPGAFYLDQAYFKGAVEILRHLDEVDFGRLYGGQIALQDLDRVYFLIRKEVVRLPRFLNSAEKLKAYMAHCRRLIKENQIQISTERVCRQVFVRTAKELFKPKAQEGAKSVLVDAAAKMAQTAPRSIDLSRLEGLAKPKQLAVSDGEALDQHPSKRRDLDLDRLANLAAPRVRAEPEEEATIVKTSTRPPDVGYLDSLARPRNYSGAISDTDVWGSTGGGDRPKREPSRARLIELAMPRQAPIAGDAEVGGSLAMSATATSRPTKSRRETSAPATIQRNRSGQEAGTDMDDAGAPLPPPPPSWGDNGGDLLTGLALPRKSCAQDGCCPPKANRRRRKTKCRILALARERRARSKLASTLPDDQETDVNHDDSMEASLLDQALDDILYVVDDSALHAAPADAAMAAAPVTALDNTTVTAVAVAADSVGAAASGAPGLPSPCEDPVVSAKKLVPRSKVRARSASPFVSVPHAQEQDTCAASRPRIPVGLPRGMAAPAAEGSMWKAVPIKTMEFGL